MSIDTPPIGASPSFIPVKVCNTVKVCACVTWLVATINRRTSRKTKAVDLIVLPTVNAELFAGFVMRPPLHKRPVRNSDAGTLHRIVDGIPAAVANCRNQAWLLKNSLSPLIRVESGDQKCLEIREDRL
jgi:hypothetical protein